MAGGRSHVDNEILFCKGFSCRSGGSSEAGAQEALQEEGGGVLGILRRSCLRRFLALGALYFSD